MPASVDSPPISQVFLSATARDCERFRKVVRDAVRASGGGRSLFLQEDWAEAAQIVVDVCKRRVDTCDAYVGLFGLRYGWVPPGFNQAITELEFRWAVDRWRGQTAPIFVLLPRPGSEAERTLIELAEQFLPLDYPDEPSRDKAVQSHQAFLDAVRRELAADGQMMAFYSDPMELSLSAVNCLHNWDMKLIREARSDRLVASGDIPLDELGRIGHKPQLRALEDALDELESGAHVPAAAFLLHGPPQHGQRQFAETLLNWDRLSDMERLKIHPLEDAGAEAVVEWACRQLRQPVLGTPTVAALADLLAVRLARKSVLLVLRSLGQSPDRLARFRAEVWQPLQAALATLRAGPGRLVCVVVDHEVLPTGGAEGVDTGQDVPLDPGRLRALPVLAPLSETDVQKWLVDVARDLALPLPLDRRRDIARRATTPDGHPPDVYERLNNEGFWSANV